MTTSGATDSRPAAPEPLPVPVVDSHCHLDMRLDGSSELTVADALEAAAQVGVERIIQIGCEVEGARWSVEIAREHEHVWAGVALHPNEAPRLAASGGGGAAGREAFEQAFAEISQLAKDPVVRAVGETGLDHFRTDDVEGLRVQEESFRLHIDLAKQLGKPLVIHDRESHDAVLRVLREEGAPEVVVFHCFSGDAAMARECVRAGYHLSFAGTVTFKNAAGLREALLEVPDELVLVETDAPFLTPTPYRGRPNASYLVPLTMRAMAQVRDQPLAELCTAVRKNSERVFGPL